MRRGEVSNVSFFSNVLSSRRILVPHQRLRVGLQGCCLTRGITFEVTRVSGMFTTMVITPDLSQDMQKEPISNGTFIPYSHVLTLSLTGHNLDVATVHLNKDFESAFYDDVDYESSLHTLMMMCDNDADEKIERCQCLVWQLILRNASTSPKPFY